MTCDDTGSFCTMVDCCATSDEKTSEEGIGNNVVLA